MKKFIILITFSCVLSVFTIYAQKDTTSSKFKSAIEYNDYIILEQEKVGTYMNRLSQSVEAGTFKDMRDALDSLRLQTKKSLKVIKKLRSYNNSNDFRDAAVKLFSFYYKISKKEFKTMVNLFRKGNNFSEKDYKSASDLDKRISDEEDALDTIFGKAQKKFAMENNFTIGE